MPSINLTEIAVKVNGQEEAKKTVERFVKLGVPNPCGWEGNIHQDTRYYCVTSKGNLDCSYSIPPNKKEISCSDFLSTTEEKRKPTSYKLIKNYPDSYHELGDITPYSSGKLSKYPEFWQPIYEPEEEVLVLGSKEIKVTISKGKIEADGKEFDISWVQGLLPEGRNNYYNNYKISPASWTIGCSIFSVEEIQKIVDTYKKLNPIENGI